MRAMSWTVIAVIGLTSGCWEQGGEELPGELIGTFEAAGLMVEQSCGAAIPAPDPLELKFDLRSESNGRAYWQQWGGSTFAGVEDDGRYTFQISQSWVVIEPDRFRGYVGCSVTQRDVFTFEVDVIEPTTDPDGGVPEDASMERDADAGLEPLSFTMTGSQITEIAPVTGSDCTPAVAATGGPFTSLPCRVEYVLTGDGIAAE